MIICTYRIGGTIEKSKHKAIKSNKSIDIFAKIYYNYVQCEKQMISYGLKSQKWGVIKQWRCGKENILA